jgi:hypothetical protein
MNGTQGFQMFNETVAKVEAYRQILSKQQKLQLAALKRAAVRQDLLGDWKPLIDRAFIIWGF